MQACDDGWRPFKLAYLHPKFKTPVILLGILYGLGVLCIFTGLDISILGNIAVVANTLIGVIISIFLWGLPKVVPGEWETSKFKCSAAALKLASAVSAVAGRLNVYLNAIQLSTPLLIGNVAVIIGPFIFAWLRMKTGRVHAEVSYEKG